MLVAWNNTKIATYMYLCKYAETHNQAFLRQSNVNNWQRWCTVTQNDRPEEASVIFAILPIHTLIVFIIT